MISAAGCWGRAPEVGRLSRQPMVRGRRRDGVTATEPSGLSTASRWVLTNTLRCEPCKSKVPVNVEVFFFLKP